MKVFTTKQLFNVVDGRLSTSIEDIDSILTEFMGEPISSRVIAFEFLKKINPQWYQDARVQLDEIKGRIGNDFNVLMEHIEKYYSEYTFEVTCYTKSPNRVGSKSYTSDLLYEWN